MLHGWKHQLNRKLTLHPLCPVSEPVAQSFYPHEGSQGEEILVPES